MPKMITRLLAGATVACAATGAIAADAVVPDPNYPGGRATAYAVIVAAEKLLGLEIDTITSTAVPVIWEGMNRGDGQIDIWTEVWLPNQQNLMEKYVNENKTVKLTENHYEAIQGYCATKDTADKLGLKSVYDLTNPDVVTAFDSNGDGRGELWIGPVGWMSTNIEQVRARDYGFSDFYELGSYEELVATANLDRAVKEGRGWIGYCYGPHQNFILYDLVLLEEPAHDAEKFKVVQPDQDPNWFELSSVSSAYADTVVHMAYSATLEERQPDLVKLLNNMQITADDVNLWSYEIAVNKREPREVLEAWFAANEARVYGWVK